MTEIRIDNQFCTVIVTVDADLKVMGELESHAAEGLRRFSELNGFVSGALHKSTDGSRLVQYLQWASEADHLACMNDRRWDEIPSTKRFMELIDSGQATIDVNTYSVIACADASGGA